MATQERSYIGKGEINLKVRGSTDPLLPVGNVSALSVEFDENTQSVPDFTSPGGGEANSLTRISSVTGSMTNLDITAENLSRAMRGAVEKITGGTQVSNEVHATAGVDGELIPFDKLPDTSASITVENDTSATALTEGTDYEVTSVGIKMIGDTIGTDGVSVSYTQAPQEIMQALVSAGQEFKLVFNGLNEAQSGKPVNITLHRIKFNPAGMDFIGDDFAELENEFAILADNSITGAGISRFMKVVQAT